MALTSQEGDKRLLAQFLTNQAVKYIRNQDNVRAEALLHQARDLAREVQDPLLEALILENLTVVLRQEGRFDDMNKVLNEAYTIYLRLEYAPGIKKTLLRRAEAASLQRIFPAAAHIYKEILERFSNQLDNFERMTILENLSQAFSSSGYPDDATKYRNELKTLVQSIISSEVNDEDIKTVVRAYHILSRILSTQEEELASALNLLDHGISIAIEAGLITEAADMNEFSASLLRMAGRHTESLEYHHRALQMAEQQRNNYLRAIILLNMGTTLRELGRLQEGSRRIEEALEIAHQLEHRGLEAEILVKLAVVNYDLGRLDDGIKLDREAAIISRSLGNRETEARALLGLASAAYQQKDYETTTTIARQILEMRENLPKDIVSEMLGTLALSLRMQKQYREAVEYIEEALSLGKRTFVEKATLIFYAGVIHAESGNKSLALEKLEEALKILKNDIFSHLTANILQYRGDIYRSLGNTTVAQLSYEQALAHLKILRGQILYEQDRLSFLGDLASIPEKLVDIQIEQHNAIGAFSTLEAAKSRSFLERLGLSDLQLPHTLPKETREQEELLRQRIKSQEQAVWRANTEFQRQRLVKELNILLDDYNAFLDGIHKNVPEYVEWRRGATIPFKEVSDLLL